MALQLKLEVGNYLDAALERVLDISDYFIYRKHVSLTEGLLFFLALIRAVWYLVFGVTGSSVVSGVFPAWVWQSIFSLLTVWHFCSFFAKRLFFRTGAIGTSAVVWLFLAILSIFTINSGPVAPTFALFAIFAGVVMVRLIHEKVTDA